MASAASLYLSTAGLLGASLKNTCANCDVYQWMQKEDKITLRCGGCKFFFYCSKECQEEHWKKTHRQHCKHLAKLKQVEHYSKQELDAELDLLSTITTDPNDRSERATKVMLRLLEKIKLETHSAAEKVQIEKVEDELLDFRMKIYGKRLFNPKEVHPGILNIDPASAFSRLSESDASKTFKSLTFLLMGLFLSKIDHMLKSPEKSLPTAWREASRNVREGPFLVTVDKILDALEDNLIPYSEVTNIAFGGNLQQNCAVCKKGITSVTRMWYLPPFEDVVFYCGSLECLEKYLNKISYGMWNEVLLSTHTKLMPTQCDFCFLCAPLEEVHRSLCKTKNYCSKTCRNSDDKVHKVCCREGGQVDERKVKIGGKQKVEVADAKQKDLVSHRLSTFEESPKLLELSGVRKMVRYNTKLMQKIQLKERRRQGEEVSEVD